MLKKLLKIFAVLVVIALGAIFLPRLFGPGQADNFYRTQRVVSGQLRVAVGATGTINPVMVVNVGTQISGTITEILADFNDAVKEGQLLMVLDDQLFKAKADMSRANLANAQAQLRLAELKHERQEKLFKNNSATKEELDTAQANLDMARASVAQHEASMAQDVYNLNNTRILAPVDGVVINRAVDVGQTVAASFQTPTLIDIAGDLTEMQINASFAEADIGRLTPGLAVVFTVDAYPGENFKGTLRQIRLNPTITSNVVTYDVVIDVGNPDLKLLPGMTAYVDIELYREDDVLLVPNAALNYRPAGFDQPAPPQTAGGGGGTGGGEAGSSRTSAPPAGAPAGDVSTEAPPDDPAASGGPVSEREAAGHWGGSDPTAPADGDEAPEQTTRGRVFALENNRPRMVSLTLGRTDLRQSIVRSGDLRAGDLVVVGETAPAADRTLLSGGGGGPRRF
ncbi:MAG: efflux RND transporter periplasmic adaptor subunit [Deltaproteobacteria bacterium]|nr:efflux RND transporter periplasmic adaptor subunit [Deltaproteobacteria bacterium]